MKFDEVLKNYRKEVNKLDGVLDFELKNLRPDKEAVLKSYYAKVDLLVGVVDRILQEMKEGENG